MIIGIDFGTTFSETACLDRHGTPTIIPNARGEHATPTVVYKPASGPLLFGTDALEQAAIDPARLARSFKLKLGSTDSVLGDVDDYTAADAAADVLAHLKETASRHLGVEIAQAVITVPANFRDDSKQAIEEAAQRAGLEVILLLAEPTAAGFAYAINKDDERCTFLVFDFGGGTLDVSVVRKDGADMRVLATEGVPQLGGEDLSRCLMQRVLADVEKTCGRQPDEHADGLFFLDLQQKVERAKASLAKQPVVPIVVAYGGSQVITRVSADDFHQDIAPYVKRSLEAMDKAAAAAGLGYDDVDRLVMVGGTSRIPYIQQRVADHTGLVPRVDIDPEKAVAYGAALAAVAELAKQNKTAMLHGHAIPAPELFVRDVTAHDVGCCVVETVDGEKRLINNAVIARNTPIPCRKTESYFLEDDRVTEAVIEVLQGPAGAPNDDCLSIGELRLQNLPPEQTRTRRIQVDFAIDSNGMVTVTGVDKVSGRRQTVSVDYKRILTPRKKPSAA